MGTMRGELRYLHAKIGELPVERMVRPLEADAPWPGRPVTAERCPRAPVQQSADDEAPVGRGPSDWRNEKATLDGDIPCVRAPDVIGPLIGHSLEEIGVAPMLRMRSGGPRRLADGL